MGVYLLTTTTHTQKKKNTTTITTNTLFTHAFKNKCFGVWWSNSFVVRTITGRPRFDSRTLRCEPVLLWLKASVTYQLIKLYNFETWGLNMTLIQ